MKVLIKKTITGMLIGAIIFSLAACSEPAPETDDPATDGPAWDETEEPTENDPTIHIDGFEEVGNDGEGDSAKDNTSGLTGFYYSYSDSIGGGNYSYELITEDDGKIMFECEFREYEEYGVMSREVDEEVLDELYDIYLDQRIARWNGYDKYAAGVLDGDGFYMTMDFEDGGLLSASGDNCYPDGYYEFKESMEKVLKPIAEELLDENRREIIDRGLSGDLDSFLVTFTQHGDSGSDSYEFFITHTGAMKKNFDVQIRSDSGEFFEKGSYRYYCELDDAAIDFDGIKDLIEKYNLIEWYDYDETAEDYMNSEWFQIDFGFEDGVLSAMGTEPPENYDEFRHDFLELMVEMIKNAEANYGLEQYDF